MLKKQLIGIIGSSMIGIDPFDARSWSGSSKYFFNMCSKFGILRSAFGIEAPNLIKMLIILKNFSLVRERWRQKFCLDVTYYNSLTKEIIKNLPPDASEYNILQIGGIYNIPECMNQKCSCFSYHDGNLAQLIKSPYLPKGITKSKIGKALNYERAVYSKMDKIFTMSEYLRRSFVDDFGIDPNKVKCIGAGINLDVFPIELEKDYEKKNILFIGIRFYRKGGEQLLNAFRAVREHYPDARLHIIGPKELKVSANLMRGVIFHGFLSRRDPVQKRLFDRVFYESSLFVMPSLYEPFGIAPLEAMVNQIPCILTNKWAFPEMVRPGINGDLVECGNVDDLTFKIERLLGDPNLLRSMGIAGRKMVLERYTWEKVVIRLIDELEAVH